MRLCCLGIHKWNRWQMLPQAYTCSERPFGTTDWLTKYTYKYQKRECQDCGHVQTRKVIGPEDM